MLVGINLAGSGYQPIHKQFNIKLEFDKFAPYDIDFSKSNNEIKTIMLDKHDFTKIKNSKEDNKKGIVTYRASVHLSNYIDQSRTQFLQNLDLIRFSVNNITTNRISEQLDPFVLTNSIKSPISSAVLKTLYWDRYIKTAPFFDRTYIPMIYGNRVIYHQGISNEPKEVSLSISVTDDGLIVFTLKMKKADFKRFEGISIQAEFYSFYQLPKVAEQYCENRRVRHGRSALYEKFRDIAELTGWVTLGITALSVIGSVANFLLKPSSNFEGDL